MLVHGPVVRLQSAPGYLIFAIAVLFVATTRGGSGAKRSFGPKLCPVVTAYVRNALIVLAFDDDDGTTMASSLP